MKVHVALVAFRGLAPATPIEKEFKGEEFTIGRASDNDIEIHDPDRYCSRYHVRCYQISGNYYLEDTSSPGTQINAGHFLTRGQRHKLQNGDQVVIGENQLLFTIDADQPRVSNSESIDSFSIDDFFGDTNSEANEEYSEPLKTASLPNIPMGQTDDFYSGPRHAERKSTAEELHDFFDLAGLEEQQNGHHSSLHDVIDENKYETNNPLQRPGKVGSETENNRDTPPQPVMENAVNSDHPQSELPIDSRAIRAFLEGLGLQSEDLIGLNKVDIMRSAGEMLSILTSGTMEILKTRAEIKKEFGMDVTRIGAAKNNPLKFCQSADQAMLKMLTHADGYMGPEESVTEGVVDVKAHQVAVMSGMQAALSALLERFEPKHLENQLTSRFVLSKKGKYWDLYTQGYIQLLREAQDNFHGLYGEEFSRVYEEQVRKLDQTH